MLHHPSFPTLSSLPISFNKFLAFTVTKSIFFLEKSLFLIGYRIAERKDKVGEPGRRSMRLGDDFDWLGGYCANHEAPEVRGPGLMDAYHPLPQWGR